MILKTVYDTIQSVDRSMPFDDYFQDYILRMQSIALDSEFEYMLQNNRVSVLQVDMLIAKYLDELVTLNDKQ